MHEMPVGVVGLLEAWRLPGHCLPGSLAPAQGLSERDRKPRCLDERHEHPSPTMQCTVSLAPIHFCPPGEPFLLDVPPALS